MARIVGGMEFSRFWISTDSNDSDCKFEIDPNKRTKYIQLNAVGSKKAQKKNFQLDFQEMARSQAHALVYSGAISDLEGYYVVKGGERVRLEVNTREGKEGVYEILKDDSGLRGLIDNAVTEPHDSEEFREANPDACFSVDEVSAKNSQNGSNGTPM